MSAGAGMQVPWQKHRSGPESIPLRDRSPSTSVLHEPSNTGSIVSEEEDTSTRAEQNRLQAQTRYIISSKKQRLLEAGTASELQKHTLALLLILVYAFVAIFSWSITCFLSYQPIGVPTYFDQSGNYSRSHYETTDNWRRAASVGHSVAGVISIPVTSAICAKAAAVYCQRRSDVKMPALSLRQMLVLADKGWTDLATLFNVVRPSTSRRTRSPLLILSVGLVAIGFVIPITQTLLVGTGHVSVLSMQDVENTTMLGYQVTPQSLREISNGSVMDSIISSTITGKFTDKQPFLWSLGQSSSSIISVGHNIVNSSSFNEIAMTQFLATFPIGTDTGVLRDHALRLNLSVDCDLVPQTDFPSRCPGTLPLDQTFTNINISTSTPFGDLTHPRYRARICAPGNILSSPWNDTSDRQDISEEVWIDYQVTAASDFEMNVGSNYTQHCYGNSTLGYFELPNYWNGHVVGLLLDKVPPKSPNTTWVDDDPSQLTAGSPVGLTNEGVPGPFLTAVLAIFGPNSFFTATAANSNSTSTYMTLQLCPQLRYPFTGLSLLNRPSSPISQILDFNWFPESTTLWCPLNVSSDYPTPPLLQALMNWMPNFGNKDAATAAFTLATYAAGNAILNIGSDEYSSTYFVSTSPGTSIQKPTISLAGIVVVSLLLATQIVGLMLLALYASRSAAWTASLDSFAMLRVGAEIGKKDMPSVSAVEAKNAKVLDERNGWVGDTEFERREDGVDVRELGLGGQGRVRDNVMYRMVRRQDRDDDTLTSE